MRDVFKDARWFDRICYKLYELDDYKMMWVKDLYTFYEIKKQDEKTDFMFVVKLLANRGLIHYDDRDGSLYLTNEGRMWVISNKLSG